MKQFKFICLMLLLSSSIFFVSCEKDDPDIENEEEVITTLVYTLVPEAGGETAVLRFEDLDGDGGNAPVITGDTLVANQTYSGSITLANEQEDPPEDITAEIEEEDAEHQFFFTSTLSGLSVAYADQDASGQPVGLETRLETGNAGSGTLTVILRHEPDKVATGVADGNITNAGGETDIEVSFPIYVQ